MTNIFQYTVLNSHNDSPTFLLMRFQSNKSEISKIHLSFSPVLYVHNILCMQTIYECIYVFIPINKYKRNQYSVNENKKQAMIPT